ncbi:MAG: efflux RND transporter periplasmic adaptor subunit [Bryobacteraceae bacterium]
MRRALAIVLPLGVLVLGVLAAWLLMRMRPAVVSEAVEPEPPSVRVLVVQPENVQLVVWSQGTVQPQTETSIVAEVAGRVISVSPSLAAGAFFASGEVLARLDPRDYEFAVTRTRAEVAQANLQVVREEQEAEVALAEWRELGQGRPPSPLLLRIPQLQEARAALEAARAALANAELNLQRTRIRAPYEGRVREKNVDVGQFVGQGTQIARVYGVAYAEVVLPIPDDEAAFIDLPLDYRGVARRMRGSPVILGTQFAGRWHEWRGYIERTEAELDPRSRMIQAVARVDDPYGRRRENARPPLAVGMFVEARILGRIARRVFVVPRAALLNRNQVLVVDEVSRLRFRLVDLLRTQDDSAIIRSGLRAGERVVVSPVETPVEGMRVQVFSDVRENRRERRPTR